MVLRRRQCQTPACAALLAAQVLYPAAFIQDLRPIVREFYNRFYHQTTTDAQPEQLLVAPKTR